jgi:hypothetical protein
MADPVVWAILRVVQAQNDLAHAINQVVDHDAPKRMVEAALAERPEAIAALQKAFEQGRRHGHDLPGDCPRGFQ